MKTIDFNEIDGKYQIFQWNALSFRDIHWKITVFRENY